MAVGLFLVPGFYEHFRTDSLVFWCINLGDEQLCHRIHFSSILLHNAKLLSNVAVAFYGSATCVQALP